MKKLVTGLFAILFLCFIHHQTYAQAFFKERKGKDIGYIAVGGSVGIMNYFGDLNPLQQYVSTDITATRPSIGIEVVRKISPRVMGRVMFSWGRLTGNDFKAADPTDKDHRYRYIRNAHFRNDIYELSLTFTYDLKPSRFIYYKRANYTPFIVIGIAGFYHNPMAKAPESLGGGWTALRPLSTEGQGLVRSSGPNAGTSYGKKYSLFQPAIPIGAGVRFKLNDRTDLSVEVAYRWLFTDYIDDVSKDYANPADLPSDLSRAMADRTLEQIDARTGGSRVDDLAKLKQEFGLEPNARFAGFGIDGDKRGEATNTDVYILTAVHLTRIINVGLRCPKFK